MGEPKDFRIQVLLECNLKNELIYNWNLLVSLFSNFTFFLLRKMWNIYSQPETCLPNKNISQSLLHCHSKTILWLFSRMRYCSALIISKGNRSLFFVDYQYIYEEYLRIPQSRSHTYSFLFLFWLWLGVW